MLPATGSTPSGVWPHAHSQLPGGRGFTVSVSQPTSACMTALSPQGATGFARRALRDRRAKHPSSREGSCAALRAFAYVRIRSGYLGTYDHIKKDVSFLMIIIRKTPPPPPPLRSYVRTVALCTQTVMWVQSVRAGCRARSAPSRIVSTARTSTGRSARSA